LKATILPLSSFRQRCANLSSSSTGLRTIASDRPHRHNEALRRDLGLDSEDQSSRDQLRKAVEKLSTEPSRSGSGTRLSTRTFSNSRPISHELDHLTRRPVLATFSSLFFCFLPFISGGLLGSWCSARCRSRCPCYQRMRVNKCSGIIDAIQRRLISRRDLRRSSIDGKPGSQVEEIDVEFCCRLCASCAES